MCVCIQYDRRGDGRRDDGYGRRSGRDNYYRGEAYLGPRSSCSVGYKDLVVHAVKCHKILLRQRFYDFFNVLYS